MIIFGRNRCGQQRLYSCRIGKRSRNGPKVRIAFPAHEPEGVQKKHSSLDVNIQGSDSPYARRQLGLGNLIDAAFVKTSEDPPAKRNIFHQLALHLNNALMCRFHPDSPFHSAVHLGFPVFGGEFRVRTEIKAQQSVFAPGKSKKNARGKALTILIRRCVSAFWSCNSFFTASWSDKSFFKRRSCLACCSDESGPPENCTIRSARPSEVSITERVSVPQGHSNRS